MVTVVLPIIQPWTYLTKAKQITGVHNSSKKGMSALTDLRWLAFMTGIYLAYIQGNPYCWCATINFRLKDTTSTLLTPLGTRTHGLQIRHPYQWAIEAPQFSIIWYMKKRLIILIYWSLVMSRTSINHRQKGDTTVVWHSVQFLWNIEFCYIKSLKEKQIWSKGKIY